MVTTRSKARADAGTQDGTDEQKRASTKRKRGVKRENGKETSASFSTRHDKGIKRESEGETTAPPSKKRAKGSVKETTSDANSAGDTKININRSPVLQLWSACVAHFVYPQLPWETCISAGSAISTICAVSKGRSIGTVDPSTTTEDKKRKREEARERNKELDAIDVMQFHLKLKDGRALVGSQEPGKPGAEAPLIKKFGQKEYSEAKKVFEECLQKWKGKETQLNQKAFQFYEQFRPQIAGGQKGWGKKGELSFAKVRDTIGSE
jgi:hypothetical protein